MVPKVAAKGKSFKGAGLYYLHDKKASSDERVAFTHTENLPTDDAELAIKIMAHTAMHQAELKAANGNVRTGRKLTQTVYTYSLSWAPDETPSAQEMLDAARETMHALGIQDHEALLVAHNDEPHPHIHVIVNRVNPRTGLAAKLSNDRLVLSRWAEDYERRQGQIRCEQRVENNAARKKGQFVKDGSGMTKAEFHAWRKTRLAQAFARRQIEEKNLSAYHKGQRDFLFDEKERRIESARAEVKAAFKPKWAGLFKQQREEMRRLAIDSRAALSRLKVWFRRPDLRRRGGLAGALEAFIGRGQFEKQLAVRHEAERKALSREVREANLNEIKIENQAYRNVLDRLKAEQSNERFSLKQEHAKESQDLAREIKAHADAERSQTLREEFRKRVGRRIRKARKRGDRGRGKGNERERE